MAATIQIKRASSATANTAPSGNLAAGELAVSYGNAPASDNGGGRLFIGNSAGNGNIVIGGQYFTDLLDHTPGTLTNSSAIITNSSGQIDTLKVGKTSTAGIIDFLEGDGGSAKVRVQAPNALAGDVTLTLPATDGDANQFLQTNGSGVLSFATVTSTFTLAADSGSNDTFNTGETLTFTGTDPIDTTVGDGSITISIDTASTTAKGAASFASADFAVSGAGEVTIHSVSNAQLAGSIANAKLANSSITIGSDAVALGGSRTDLNGLTSVDVDNITIDGNIVSTTNSNGNLELAPNGTGTVTVPSGYKDRSGFGANSLATKQYVDAIKTGLDVKDSVRVATTANITISTALNSGDQIDGVTLADGDRVLVKNQSTASQNGIYVVGSSPARSTDMDDDVEVTGGTFVFVEEGTANADNGYVISTDGTITVGSTAFTWTQFSGAGQITAGNGLVKGTGASANTINAVGTADKITVSADNITIATTYVGQTSITTLGTITTGTWNGSTIGTSKGGTGLTAAAKGSVLVANTADTLSALDGGGSTDKILFYNQGSDTITWESSLDAGTF